MIKAHICTGNRLFFISLIGFFVHLMSSATAKTGSQNEKVIVCYISTWAVYRPSFGSYSLDNFDGSLCTHAIYAFAGLDITQSAIKSLDPWQDLKEEYGKGGYERLTGMKQNHPHLKVSLAIGGWNQGSKNYSIMVADPLTRGKFVKQVTSFIRKYNFDGLDLDWEYPTQRGGDPKDRENFVLLVKELHEQFKPHGLILTSAIGAAKNVIDQAYDIRQLSRYLDFLHVMCYDYHGSWDNKVGYNAPLYALNDDPLSVQFTIDYLLKMGAPSEKLVMGVPFYGRTFKTPFEGNIEDETDGTAFQGPFTREDGFLGYNEICQILSNKTSGWTTMWDPETSQILARSEKDTFTGITQVVTYDNSRSIANKVKFAMEKNLAGIMIWSIDTDDFLGKCDREIDTFDDYKYIKESNVHIPQRIQQNYPLLRTINEGLILAKEDIELQKRKEAEDEANNIKFNEIPHGPIENVNSMGNCKNPTLIHLLFITLAVFNLFSYLI